MTVSSECKEFLVLEMVLLDIIYIFLSMYQFKIVQLNGYFISAGGKGEEGCHCVMMRQYFFCFAHSNCFYFADIPYHSTSRVISGICCHKQKRGRVDRVGLF